MMNTIIRVSGQSSPLHEYTPLSLKLLSAIPRLRAELSRSSIRHLTRGNVRAARKIVIVIGTSYVSIILNY